MTSALEGKVAIVTGACRGMGAGIAKEFAAQGATVVGYGSDKKGADAVAPRPQQAADPSLSAGQVQGAPPLPAAVGPGTRAG